MPNQITFNSKVQQRHHLRRMKWPASQLELLVPEEGRKKEWENFCFPIQTLCREAITHAGSMVSILMHLETVWKTVWMTSVKVKIFMSLFWRSHKRSHDSHLSKKQRKTAANSRIPQYITGCWLLVIYSQSKWAAKSVDATYVIHTYGGQVLKDRTVLTGLNKHHSAVKRVNHSPPACVLLKILNLLHE